MRPKHGKARIHHFAPGGQVQPDLEKARGIVPLLFDQGKHFRVHHAFSGRHPLDVALSVATRVTEGIGVVDNAVHGGGDGFKAPVHPQKHDFSIHLQCYQAVYNNAASAQNDTNNATDSSSIQPAWIPTAEQAQATHVAHEMRRQGMKTYL